MPITEYINLEGDCYNINAYKNKMVKKSLLYGLENELNNNIELNEIENTVINVNILGRYFSEGGNST
jgi:hypothetical protein